MDDDLTKMDHKLWLVTVGERIRTARKAKGWSQRKLSEVSGVSETSLRNYEIGRNEAGFYSIEKLAIALDTTTDAFRGW